MPRAPLAVPVKCPHFVGTIFIFAPFLSAYLAQILNNEFLLERSNLVAYYSFKPGRFLLDGSGNKNLNPTNPKNPPHLSSVCYFDDGCAEFNASEFNSFNLSTFMFTRSFTVCSWIYPYTFHSANVNYVIFDFGNGVGNDEIILFMTSTNNLVLNLFHPGANSISFYTVLNSIRTNIWHHVCVSRNVNGVESSGSWSFFINGTQLKSAVDYVVQFVSKFPVLTIGAAMNFNYIGQVSNPSRSSTLPNTYSLGYFSGKIDDFRWYNVSLPTSNISSLYMYYVDKTAGGFTGWLPTCEI